MDRLHIRGGIPLCGKVSASGSKNAALPILAAAIMLEGESHITNIPYLNDVSVMIKMLNSLGIRAEYHASNSVRIWNNRKVRHIAPYELVTAMRASFFVAGPVLARTGYAKVPMPGGCSIGTRPIDIHLKWFRALGASISIEHGFVELKTKKLVGAEIFLDFPSVGATENIMMAACLAEGKTIINNAAHEPEIVDLALCLVNAGGRIKGAGTSSIVIEGVSSLKGVQHAVIPDRVEAGTLLISGAITKGDVTVENVNTSHLDALIRKLKECQLNVIVSENSVRVSYSGAMEAVDIETLPFPGFPTDMQAQMMALMTISKGSSIIRETIFENRFLHAPELIRMGAKIKIQDHHAIVEGVPRLSGAEVKITDLRAGASLVLAGLCADQITTVYGLSHLRRGYDDLTGKLGQLGGGIDGVYSPTH